MMTQCKKKQIKCASTKSDRTKATMKADKRDTMMTILFIVLKSRELKSLLLFRLFIAEESSCAVFFFWNSLARDIFQTVVHVISI